VTCGILSDKNANMIVKDPRNVSLSHYVSVSFYILYNIAFKCSRQ